MGDAMTEIKLTDRGGSEWALAIDRAEALRQLGAVEPEEVLRVEAERDASLGHYTESSAAVRRLRSELIELRGALDVAREDVRLWRELAEAAGAGRATFAAGYAAAVERIREAGSCDPDGAWEVFDVLQDLLEGSISPLNDAWDEWSGNREQFEPERDRRRPGVSLHPAHDTLSLPDLGDGLEWFAAQRPLRLRVTLHGAIGPDGYPGLDPGASYVTINGPAVWRVDGVEILVDEGANWTIEVAAVDAHSVDLWASIIELHKPIIGWEVLGDA